VEQENKTVEQALEELDSLLNEMETGNKTLEENFQLYSRGLKLVQYCSRQIDGIEKQLIVLEEGEAQDGPGSDH